MKKTTDRVSGELRPQYDLRQLLKGGVRGKYAGQYQAGTNLVLLDPDVRKAFDSERAVNDALRLVIHLRKIGSAGADRRAKAKSRASHPVS
jgi:hypothetical protein